MTLNENDIPSLPRGVRVHRCDVRSGWFLLAPERALKLDQIGVAILNHVDGMQSLSEIASTLAETYQAPLDRISADVTKFLQSLSTRRMLDVQRATT